MSRPWVQQLVDELLDRVQAEHPHVEFTISLPEELTLLVPRDRDTLLRTVEGRPGYYRTHVYRDREILASPVEDHVAATPLLDSDPAHPSHDAPSYLTDLRTGEITISY